MKQRIHIKKAEIKDQKLLLYTDETIPVEQLLPGGQMLVDSDQLSFIYIAELNGEYNYVTIHDEFWQIIKDSLDQNMEVYLTNHGEQLQLTSFKDEMAYLIENIKGNSNYGEEMVEKVERIF